MITVLGAYTPTLDPKRQTLLGNHAYVFDRTPRTLVVCRWCSGTDMASPRKRGR
ncbi:MAG: hypothetical protein K0S86_5687, partial [Geminicoccaceae bacterium]|nr:hypothetical protein [Geminicoccaceae bacterium]